MPLASHWYSEALVLVGGIDYLLKVTCRLEKHFCLQLCKLGLISYSHTQHSVNLNSIMAKKSYASPEAAREAILDAAESIVVDVGPAGLRISAVAKAAGMAHPNIIHHFGSRDGLINALAERVGRRATDRITRAIDAALVAPEAQRVDAMTNIFNTAYEGDEGKVAVWMHLSGAQSSLKPNMERIVEASHHLRQSMDGEVSRANTSRIVMLITLALVGEVVSGVGVKEALGFGAEGHPRANFKRWLAELLLSLDDNDLNSSLDALPLNKDLQ